MRYIVRTILISFILIILLTACAEEIEPTDMEGRLKVIVNDGGYPFTYGNELSSAFPNVQFDFVEISKAISFQLTPEMNWYKELKKRLKEFYEKEQADIYILRYTYIKDLLEDGGLHKLNALIENDQFDVENIHPNIMETIKNWGGGQIYGLAPTFKNYAIYYNKDLFELHGVPEPHDQMTWDDVLSLAKRFPTEDADGGRTYGFAFRSHSSSDIASVIRYMGLSAGLQQYNVDTKQITMQGDVWLDVVEKAVDAFRSGTILRRDDEQEIEWGKERNTDYAKWYMKLMQRSAMVLGSLDTLNSLITIERRKDLTDVRWGVVTVPVNPQYIDEDPYGGIPPEDGGLQPDDFVSISSETDNMDLSWEVVKYINSEEFAMKKSKITGPSIQMFSRTDLNPEYGGNSIEPLYKLKPIATETVVKYLPFRDFFLQFDQLIHEEIDQVIAGEQSAEAALEHIQNQGQILIMK